MRLTGNPKGNKGNRNCIQSKPLKASKIKGFKGFAKNGFWVRLPSSPLTTPVKSRVCGVVKHKGNKQVTTFTKGERLNGVLLVKNIEISYTNIRRTLYSDVLFLCQNLSVRRWLIC